MTAKKLSASKGRPRARVIVKNVNRPGKSRPVDAANYQAMRRTLLRVLPPKSPGFTLFELYRVVLPRLPADLFPGGAKAGWWMKTVQLDLEGRELSAQKDQAVAVAPVMRGRSERTPSNQPMKLTRVFGARGLSASRWAAILGGNEREGVG